MRIYISYPMSKPGIKDYYDIYGPPKFIKCLTDNKLYVAAVRKDWKPKFKDKNELIDTIFKKNNELGLAIKPERLREEPNKYLRENIEYLYTANLLIAYIPFYSLGVLGEINLWIQLHNTFGFRDFFIVTTREFKDTLTRNVWFPWIRAPYFIEDDEDSMNKLYAYIKRVGGKVCQTA